MNLIFRLLYLAITIKFKSKVEPLGTCRTQFRCWPTDCDVLLHMNNGKYFSLMDLARVDLMGRSGLLKVFQNKGWYPVVVAETAKFRRPINPFEKFEIETSIFGWDEKAVLIGQKFIKKGDVVCEAVVRGRFLKKSGGTVTTAELLKASNISSPAPELEPWIANWNESQA